MSGACLLHFVGNLPAKHTTACRVKCEQLQFDKCYTQWSWFNKEGNLLHRVGALDIPHDDQSVILHYRTGDWLIKTHSNRYSQFMVVWKSSRQTLQAIIPVFVSRSLWRTRTPHVHWSHIERRSKVNITTNIHVNVMVAVGGIISHNH